MKNSRGFTVLEMVMVMVVMGIMASLTFVKYQRTVAENELDRAANKLYMEIRGLRALAFKYDDTVKVTFNPTAAPPQATIWVWASADATPAYKTKLVHRISPPVKMGVPDDVTPTEPFNDAWWNNFSGAIVDGLQGKWKTECRVIPDSRGEYDHGGVYLCSPRCAKTVYFIGISMSMQSIEFKKWNGKTWDKL